MMKKIIDMRTFLLVTFFAIMSIIFVISYAMSENLFGYAYNNELEAAKKEILAEMQSNESIGEAEIEAILSKHLSNDRGHTITPIYGSTGESHYADAVGFEITRKVYYLHEEREQTIVVFGNKLGSLGTGYNMIDQQGGGS